MSVNTDYKNKRDLEQSLIYVMSLNTAPAQCCEQKQKHGVKEERSGSRLQVTF